MVKSGLIIGVISLLLILGISFFLSYCAPCLGIFLGLAAGFLAGVFDKPISSRDSLIKGGFAGAIAGAIGLLGGLIAAIFRSQMLSPATFESIYRMYGFPGIDISQTQIFLSLMGLSLCIGLFDVVLMAVLGIAGGAVWFQISGKNRVPTVLPPQEPLPPSV